MIDPKLNELPVKRSGTVEDADESALSPDQGEDRRRQVRAGLSINDTVARNASLSVGSRGADTSGVEAGTGAGAGLTRTTPTSGSTPAPEVVPGARGSGTTARGSVGVDQEPTVRVDEQSDWKNDTAPSSDRIAARAFECWHARGCPDGSPEVDWHQAEQELRERERRVKSAGA